MLRVIRLELLNGRVPDWQNEEASYKIYKSELVLSIFYFPLHRKRQANII